jgi:hypothetical protein
LFRSNGRDYSQGIEYGIGYPGILYNAIDENNFDFVLFNIDEVGTYK